MTEPMSKQRLKDLKEWGEARGPLLIIRELTDEIDRLREELRIEKDATCEACAKNYHENKRLRESDKLARYEAAMREILPVVADLDEFGGFVEAGAAEAIAQTLRAALEGK